MLYDYKDEDRIQDVILDSYQDLVDDIIDEYETLRRNQVLYIYAPACVASEIIDELIETSEDFYYDEDCFYSELLDSTWNEVLITVYDDGMLFIEEARGITGKIKTADGTSVLNYVYDSFKKNDIETLALEEDSILVFGFDDDSIIDDYTVNGERVSKEDFDNYVSTFKGDKKPVKTENNNDVEKSSTATIPSVFYINGEKVDKSTYDEIVKEIDDIYLNNMKAVLLNYCDWMDMINDIRSSFF
jgi:hypothetical protein